MNIRLLLLMTMMGVERMLEHLGVKVTPDAAQPELDGVAALMTAKAEVAAVDPVQMEGDVAVINVTGPLLRHPSPWRRQGLAMWPTYGEIAAAAERVRTDRDIRGAVIRIDSPGGLVTGSRDGVEALRRLSKSKPTVTWVDGMAASAGYNLAAVTRHVVMGSETDIVGSVGGVIVLADFSAMLEREGIRIIPVTTGKLKAAGAFGTAITDEHIAAFRRLLTDSVAPFMRDVEQGRGMTRKQIDAMEAEVFVGPTAIRMGLADEIGSLQHAIALARGGLETKRAQPKHSADRAAADTEVGSMNPILKAFLHGLGLSVTATDEEALAFYREKLSPEQRTQASRYFTADGSTPTATVTPAAPPAAPAPAAQPAPATPAAPAAPAVDHSALIAQGIANERDRGNQIRLMAESLGIDAAVYEPHIQVGTTVEAFRQIALGHIAASRKPVSVTGGSDGREQLPTALADALLVAADRSCLTPQAGRIVEFEPDGRVRRNADNVAVTRAVHPRAAQFAGRSALEIGRSWLMAIGIDAGGWDQQRIATAMIRPDTIRPLLPGVAAGHTTSDFPLVLANVASKSLNAAFDAEPVTSDVWAGIKTVPDFKVHDDISVGRLPVPQLVRESGEYQYVTFGEKREQAQVYIYGHLTPLSLQMIVNDDLGAFTNAILDWAGAARSLDDDLVYAVLIANPTMAEDSVAMIHSTHSNLNSGSAGALAAAKLSAMRASMRQQTDVARTGHTTRRINVRPSFLLVPEALADSAAQLIASMVDITASNNTPNLAFLKTLTPVADPRLDADSAVAYYLTGDRNRSPVKRVVLRGFERPTVERIDGTTIDGVTYKLRHASGAFASEWRTVERNDGP